MGLAVLAFVAFMWFRQTRWSGTVIDAAGKPIEGVTVLLINGQKVADITATEADGSYSLVVGMKPDPALRLMFCKVMYEASPLFARASDKPKKYTLELARPDTVDPGVEKILAILPPECR